MSKFNTDILHAEQLHAKLWGTYEPVAMAHVKMCIRDRSFPMVPARTIVSAWKEIGATEPRTAQATAPIRKPRAVGTEAKP